MMHAFSKVAARHGEEMGIELVDAILYERADLRDGVAKSTLSVEFAEAGKNAYVVFIGNEVFKGPRLNKGVEKSLPAEASTKMKANQLADFESEIAALMTLKGSGLPVPEVTCVGREALFYGMTRMPGVMLHDVVKTLTPEQTENIGQALADFNIRVAQTLPMKEGKYAKHGDLHQYNILVDAQTRQLTAVIDFGKILYHPVDKLASAGLDPEFNTALQKEFDRRKSEITTSDIPQSPQRKSYTP